MNTLACVVVSASANAGSQPFYSGGGVRTYMRIAPASKDWLKCNSLEPSRFTAATETPKKKPARLVSKHSGFFRSYLQRFGGGGRIDATVQCSRAGFTGISECLAAAAKVRIFLTSSRFIFAYAWRVDSSQCRSDPKADYAFSSMTRASVGRAVNGFEACAKAAET